MTSKFFLQSISWGSKILNDNGYRLCITSSITDYSQIHIKFIDQGK